MKKILMATLLIVTLLTIGCGILNLSGFITPDDPEFLAVVQSLGTPQKIANYMGDNFKYKAQINTLNPYMLWKIKKGDCNDFATFGLFVANFHGYKTYQILISYGKSSHMVAVYIEDRMSYTDNWIYNYGHDTFREIVESSMQYRTEGLVWLRYTAYDYNMKVIEKGVK